MPVRLPLGALDGGLKGDSPGDFWVPVSYASKASSYHLYSVFFIYFHFTICMANKNSSVIAESQIFVNRGVVDGHFNESGAALSE